MALILNIDTATESAGICLSKNGETVSQLENDEQKDHASWLHVAIDEIMKSNNFLMKDLDAIAVTNGPGSYTGLRVGMSAAKGLCYALQIPMITESTLRFMAYAAANQLNNIHDALLCPMIDARRMEVFAALYNSSLHELMEPTAIILDERSFSSTLQSHKTSFFGSGSMKWKKVTDSKNALFPEITCDVGYLGKLSYKKFINSQFTDIIYSQPVYIKEFQSHIKK